MEPKHEESTWLVGEDRSFDHERGDDGSDPACRGERRKGSESALTCDWEKPVVGKTFALQKIADRRVESCTCTIVMRVGYSRLERYLVVSNIQTL